MGEEVSLEFRLRKVDERTNYLLDEIKHDLMSEKYKKTCQYLNYVEHLLILVSAVMYMLYFNFCTCFISCYSCRYLCNCCRN